MGNNFELTKIQIYSPYNNILSMKKIIVLLICLSTIIIPYTKIVYADRVPPICHSFLWIKFEGNYDNCTQADIEYDDFLKNNVYPFLYILLALSSGLWYLGYKKYKAKKLMSNIETKNTSPANPE